MILWYHFHSVSFLSQFPTSLAQMRWKQQKKMIAMHFISLYHIFNLYVSFLSTYIRIFLTHHLILSLSLSCLSLAPSFHFLPPSFPFSLSQSLPPSLIRSFPPFLPPSFSLSLSLSLYPSHPSSLSLSLCNLHSSNKLIHCKFHECHLLCDHFESVPIFCDRTTEVNLSSDD